MFATRARRRPERAQAPAPPPELDGADSCYGVRSLDSSIADWAGGALAAQAESGDMGEPGDKGESGGKGESGDQPEAVALARADGIPGAPGVIAHQSSPPSPPARPRTPAPTPEEAEPAAAAAAVPIAIPARAPVPSAPAHSPASSAPGSTPTRPAPLVLSLTSASPESAPPAFAVRRDMTAHGAAAGAGAEADGAPEPAAAALGLLPGGSPRTPDAPDTLSEPPSSPASFTSLPSYVASLSSLSRTSSPAWSPYAAPRRTRGPDGSGRGRPRAAHDHELELEHEHGHEDEHDRDVEPELDLYGRAAGDGAHGGHGARGLHGLGNSAELVLPTLSLPSSSLRLALPRDRALRVAVLGEHEIVADAIGALAATERVVDVGRDEVGLVRDGNVVATFLTGMTVEQIIQRVHDSHAALHELLRPDPPADHAAAIEAMVDAYAACSDWVHAVVLVEAPGLAAPLASADRAHLERAAPVMTCCADERDMRTVRAPGLPAVLRELPVDPTRAVPAETAGVEPTPRAHAEPDSYFTPRPASLPVSPAPLAVPVSPVAGSPAAGQLAAVLASAAAAAPALRAQSTARFLASHPAAVSRALSPVPAARAPARALAYPHAPAARPLSSGPSSVDGAPIMPTVARHDGGEWEATLSRRLAARREAEHAPPPGPGAHAGAAALAPAAGRGAYTTFSRARGLRRVSRPARESAERECAPSLFGPRPAGVSPSVPPAGARGVADVGLAGLADKTFAGARRRWGWGLVACAVALAVGWGCWAARR